MAYKDLASTQPSPAPTSIKKVLAVDDDQVSLRLLEGILRRDGYHPIACSSAREAREQLAKEGADAIQCVVTDYQMPDEDGLHLLRHIQSIDSSLSTIILTGEGDKQLVATSLREGAVDFLDKPLNIQLLRNAVSKGVGETAERRRLVKTDKAAERVGQTQSHLLGLNALRELPHIRICYRPQYQAGGDFIGHFERTGGSYCFLAADVSGHDLRAAYLSAYFQGIVRGMIERNAELQEIMRFFNRFLVREWNQPTDKHQALGLEASISVCAVSVEPARKRITVINQGFPCPLLVRGNGEVITLGEANPPLGWFELCTHDEFTAAISPGDRLYLWSDGLEDQANLTGISAPALASKLVLDPPLTERRRLLDEAPDDVLIARIDLFPGQPPDQGFEPLVLETCKGSDMSNIDDRQGSWERALSAGIPQLDDADRYNILLALREAALNAMQHGCHASSSKQCYIQVAFAPATRLVRAWVRDPGDGLSSERLRELRAGIDDTNILDRHNGIVLISTIPNRVDYRDDIHALVMDFELSQTTSSGSRQLPTEPAVPPPARSPLPTNH